ncbi:MAG: hypothetical protein AB7E30_05075 [Lawsonibacter sp.]
MKQAPRAVQDGEAFAYRIVRKYEGKTSAEMLVRNLIRTHAG